MTPSQELETTILKLFPPQVHDSNNNLGNVVGTIYIEYHDNGSFRRITERNERDYYKRIVYYSEENEFLHWYEISYDSDWNELERIKFDSGGRIVN